MQWKQEYLSYIFFLCESYSLEKNTFPGDIMNLIMQTRFWGNIYWLLLTLTINICWFTILFSVKRIQNIYRTSYIYLPCPVWLEAKGQLLILWTIRPSNTWILTPLQWKRVYKHIICFCPLKMHRNCKQENVSMYLNRPPKRIYAYALDNWWNSWHSVLGTQIFIEIYYYW